MTDHGHGHDHGRSATAVLDIRGYHCGESVLGHVGLTLRPEIAALSMSGSSFLVAVNAVLLKRLRLSVKPVADA